MDLSDIQNSFEKFIKSPNNNPVCIYKNIEAYISSEFIHNYNKKYKNISKELEQLYKCFRNISYGLNEQKVFSKNGNDGIFLISTNSKKYNNKMIRAIKGYYNNWGCYNFIKNLIFLKKSYTCKNSCSFK